MVQSPLLTPLRVAHGFGELDDAGTPERCARVRQVHGTAIHWPTSEDTQGVEADALATREGLTVAIVTADCLPILLVDRVANLCAAVHAGWRGSLASIASLTVEALRAAGAQPHHLYAALGPSIGPCCYQVGEELSVRFANLYGSGVVHERAEDKTLDLGAINRIQLERAGLPSDHIDGGMGLCTHCARTENGTPRFASFRRDGVGAGRQTSHVRIPMPAPG